jgi:BirA family transcriptional regulator, biotin operon repressor / biotin---[acetyl-CoA-carboxylase] ligase
MQLDPTAKAAGVRHIALESVGSTNAEALERARWRERGPLWITALSQKAGRGRRGSVWISPKGNLYASLLLSEPSPKPLAPQLSFVAALALHDALSECAPRLGPLFKLKWPNDVLLGPDKLAGILIEGQSDSIFNVVIGFGVNCTSHPLDTYFPATNLLLAGAVVAPDVLFVALSAAMLHRLSRWQGGGGFASIRADWLARAAGLGENIRVRLPERELRGRFQGLDNSGRLLVQQPGGLTTVTAGEVFGLGGA